MVRFGIHICACYHTCKWMCDVINCCPFISLYFREVPDEVYRSLDAIGEGEKWWEVFFIPFLTCFINFRLLNYIVDEAAFDSTMCILLTEGTLFCVSRLWNYKSLFWPITISNHWEKTWKIYPCCLCWILVTTSLSTFQLLLESMLFKPFSC